jgi:hypothetical protein
MTLVQEGFLEFSKGEVFAQPEELIIVASSGSEIGGVQSIALLGAQRCGAGRRSWGLWLWLWFRIRAGSRGRCTGGKVHRRRILWLLGGVDPGSSPLLLCLLHLLLQHDLLRGHLRRAPARANLSQPEQVEGIENAENHLVVTAKLLAQLHQGPSIADRVDDSALLGARVKLGQLVFAALQDSMRLV